MQMVGRKGAADMLQLPAGRPDRFAVDLHIRLFGCAAAFFQIAGQARCGNIFPARPAAQPARDHMVKGKIVAASAIDALKFIAQKQIETSECGIFRRFYILAQRDDRWDLHIQAGAVDMLAIAGDNINFIQEHRFNRRLPRPKAERIIAKRGIIGIQHQRRAIVRVARSSRRL